MKRLLWLIIPLGLTLLLLAQPDRPTVAVVSLSLAWLGTLLHLLPPLGKPFAWLRRWPALLWLLVLCGAVSAFVAWLVAFQPAAGLPLSTTALIVAASTVFALVTIPTAGRTATQKRASLGFWAGPLVTLTTGILMIAGIELALRYVWIMSDSFSFSAMHQTWQRVYWNPINSVGIRDYPVASNDDPRTNIVILGDSFAVGYGTNSIDDTFPQQLDALLGDDYAVNTLAQPGWGVTMARLNLEDGYPLAPDVLVLSHYINDIGEGSAAEEYRQQFPQIRFEPPPEQAWWVENFFIANFLYYRATIFESTDRYFDWVAAAYNDPDVWARYQDELDALIDSAQAYDAPLVVLVWPTLVDVAGTQQATQLVADHFAERDVPVVNMSDYLLDVPTAQLVANPFDAHPSIYSHQVAAEQLAPIIANLD